MGSRRRARWQGLVIGVVLGCGPSTEPPGGAGSASGSGDETTVVSGTTIGPTTASTGTTAPATSADSSGSGTDDVTSSSGSSSGDAPDTTPPCEGPFGLYECSNGLDDDGDGLVDLHDPECTSPCDHDEGSLNAGIMHKLDTCRMDCAFDANTGQGDDGCHHRLDCDLVEPVPEWCGYAGNPTCLDQPEPVAPQCVETCQPFVPPGCDCFGCCEVDVGGVPTPIFLFGHPDCSFSNLDACTPCTPRIDECGNPCDSAGCELCLGQTELPPGCETNACDVGEPCQLHSECDGGYCMLGCCYPPPPRS